MLRSLKAKFRPAAQRERSDKLLAAHRFEHLKGVKQLRVKHSGGVGDVVYCLPALQSLVTEHHIEQVTFYLHLNQPVRYSGWHPLGKVLLDERFAEKLKPLLLSQWFVHQVETYAGQAVHVDFDLFRCVGINPATYSIARWYFLLLEGANWDLSLPWLHVDPDMRFKDYAIVGRNRRLQSPYIRYDFMNDYADRMVFVGVRREYEDFLRECPRCTRFFEATDFLELARVLAGAKFYVGNQGLPYTLAEAVKIRRLLETNVRAANNIPQGGECYDALFQHPFEHWFRRLMGD